MSEGLNKVLLLGNVGADPELKMTGGGQSVLKIRLATTESYQDKSGVWQDRTEWHSVTVWGKRAEGLHKMLKKGSQIFVEGSLHTSSFEDRDGQKRYKTEVNAKSVILGGRGAQRGDDVPDDDAPPRRPARTSNPSKPAPQNDDAPPDDDDPDSSLPF